MAQEPNTVRELERLIFFYYDLEATRILLDLPGIQVLEMTNA